VNIIPNPTRDYASATQRAAEWEARLPKARHPGGGIYLLTHGKRTERAIAFAHGYTNAPIQFLQLAQQFYERGWNAFIAPMPGHGLLDRMNSEHSRLKAEDIAAHGYRLVDVAAGLGERVTLCGLSAGGVATAYAAQTYPGLHQAAILSPGMGFKALPLPANPVLAAVSGLVPDVYGWWDPVAKDAPTPQDYTYPRFSYRTVAQLLYLASVIQRLAQRQPPQAKDILLVTNANDASVDHRPAYALADTWQAKGAAVRRYEFEASHKLDHDFIDPLNVSANTALVYPILLDLIIEQR
jgi:carboxylesterase